MLGPSLGPVCRGLLQFQGKWYAVSVAGNKFHKGNESGTMYTDTYGLKDDGSYSVTAILFRCSHHLLRVSEAEQCHSQGVMQAEGC